MKPPAVAGKPDRPQGYHAKILATGLAFPPKKLTNHDLAKLVDTSDEWIFARTGIRERRIADIKGGDSNSGLAYEAAGKALKRAGLEPNDLDMILYATVSPDRIIPTVSCILQDKLGLKNVPAVDLAAGCSGFVYALSIADAFVRSGQHQHVLVVGAEVLTSLVDWEDRGTCILFGDGAGVAIVGRAAPGEKSRILSTHLHADGSLNDLFFMEAGGSLLRVDEEVIRKRQNFMKMKGKEIYKEAVRTLVDCAVEALEANGLKISDLDWFIPHQANLRIIEAVAKRLDFPMERVITNIEKYGNTSSATVPTALDAAVEDGRVKRGDLVLMDVFGAGLTFGSALIRW